MKKDQNVNDFQEKAETKNPSTAGQKATAAAEQSDKSKVKPAAETELDKTKKELKASQAKVKDLQEAVRYRDRKIAKLGPGATSSTRKVIGSNVTDHSHLGEAEGTTEVPAQTRIAPKASKTVTTKH